MFAIDVPDGRQRAKGKGQRAKGKRQTANGKRQTANESTVWFVWVIDFVFLMLKVSHLAFHVWHFTGLTFTVSLDFIVLLTFMRGVWQLNLKMCTNHNMK
jgi:hypothetical protein